MKNVIILLLLMLTNYAFGQKSRYDNAESPLLEYHYVKADNGLIVREKPDKSAERIGKLAICR